MFHALREFKNTKASHLHENITEGFTFKAKFLSKFIRHIDNLGPAWEKNHTSINDMYQKIKRYKVWLQEHSEATSTTQDDFPLHFA